MPYIITHTINIAMKYINENDISNLHTSALENVQIDSTRSLLFTEIPSYTA